VSPPERLDLLATIVTDLRGNPEAVGRIGQCSARP
jgi:hypothetical protein